MLLAFVPIFNFFSRAAFAALTSCGMVNEESRKKFTAELPPPVSIGTTEVDDSLPHVQKEP